MKFNLIIITGSILIMQCSFVYFQGDSTANVGASNRLCATITNLGAGEEGAFFCKPAATGRYIYIRIPGINKFVTLCEVEVYSSYLPSKFCLLFSS